jgi:glycosyltransferase involved in cell wall biosynthesis
MRIAHLTSRFPKISETFILLEILELERLGFDVEVFALVRERAPVTHPEAAAVAARAHYGFPLRPRALAAQVSWLVRRPGRYLGAWAGAARGNLRSPGFLLRALAVVPVAAAWARDMERLEVEAVHAHYATHPALAAWVVHRLTDLPYSVTAHAHDIYVERAMLGPKLGEARAVVTISDFNRELIGRLVPGARDRIRVVRCGVELERLQLPASERDGPFRVLCVGSLEPYKGQRFLVDACARLRDEGLDLRCRLVGDGEDRAMLEARVAAAGLDGVVELLGAQPRERVREELAACDAFVLPSVVTPEGKMEGLPVALMEALAARRPTVATRVSGIPELVEDGVTGLLVPPEDAAALAAALRRLAEDPALGRRLAEAGHARVREQHDLERNVTRLAELLRG